MHVRKAFHPTQIAVGSPVYEDRVQKQYAACRAGNYTLSGNESEQIGYRLAKESGMKTVSPVDIEGEFLGERPMNCSKAKGKSQPLGQQMSALGERVKTQDSDLKSHTIGEPMQ